MEQQDKAEIVIYDKPVMFMGQAAAFDKDLINRPFEYKGRVCYATGFLIRPVFKPDTLIDEAYIQVHTNHTQDSRGRAVDNFIAKSKLGAKRKQSIAFEAAA